MKQYIVYSETMQPDHTMTWFEVVVDALNPESAAAKVWEGIQEKGKYAGCTLFVSHNEDGYLEKSHEYIVDPDTLCLSM